MLVPWPLVTNCASARASGTASDRRHWHYRLIAATDAAQAPAATDVYAAMDAKATEEIQRIVRANAGGTVKPAGK